MNLRLVYSFIAVAWADWESPRLIVTTPTPTLENGSSAASTTVLELGNATSGIRSSSLLRGAAASGADIADIKDNGIGFVKVQLVSSATELEAVRFFDFDRSKVPKVPFDLDFIKNMVEKDLGSSEKLEYFRDYKWEPLSKMSDLAFYKRLAKFDHMQVVPLRVPSYYVGDDEIDGVHYQRH